MNLDDLTVAVLAASEHFQNYCLNPTTESIRYWEDWQVQHPEHQVIFTEAKALVKSLAMEPSEKEINAAFLDFKVAVDKRQNAGKAKLVAIPNRHLPNKNRRNLVAIAVMGLLAIGCWQYLLVPSTTLVQLATNYGEVQTHVLPDGSKVILNANSTLTYKDYWAANTARKVHLKGEAFFEVKKKSSKEPFKVRTDKGTIQVLGTSFNVKQRATTFEVALLEGSVALSIPKYPIIKMEPGELVRLEGTHFYDRSIADVDAFSAWRFQRMVFKEMTIAKVIQRLQEEFDWRVRVADQALLKRRITATIPKNDPELLLQALSAIYDLEIEELTNKTYLIK